MSWVKCLPVALLNIEPCPTVKVGYDPLKCFMDCHMNMGCQWDPEGWMIAKFNPI